MEDPVSEIPTLIHTLCRARPDIQRQAIAAYFTPDASFSHPICRTGSFDGSIWLITKIYRCYKILSPRIEVEVDSVAFDIQNLRLYVSIHQNFKLWFLPYYSAPVQLVTILQLVTDPDPFRRKALSSPQAEVVSRTNSHGKSNINVNEKREQQPGTETILSSSECDEQEDHDTAEVEHNRDGEVLYWIQSQNDLFQTTEWIKFLVPWGVSLFLLLCWHFYTTSLCIIGTEVHDTLMRPSSELDPDRFEIVTVDDKERPKLGAD